MIGYIYRTTNLINYKIYIGKCERLWNKSLNYLGSGLYLNNAINKYGKENFEKEILFWSDSKKMLSLNEIFFIKFYNSTDRSIGYNIAKGGYGGWAGNIYKNGIKLSEEHKRKIKESCKNINKGIPKSKEQMLKMVETRRKNGSYIMSDEQKRKISISCKNISKESRNKQRESMMGKIHTKETKEKIRISQLGHFVSENTKKKMSLKKQLFYAKKKNDIEKINYLNNELQRI